MLERGMNYVWRKHRGKSDVLSRGWQERELILLGTGSFLWLARERINSSGNWKLLVGRAWLFIVVAWHKAQCPELSRYKYLLND